MRTLGLSDTHVKDGGVKGCNDRHEDVYRVQRGMMSKHDG